MLKKLRVLVGLAFLGAAGSVVLGETHSNISVDDLKKALSDGSATLVDANSEDTYAAGHIPGAVSFAANASDLSKVLPKDKGAMIVAYCGGPTCSAWEKAAKAAKALGYTNVRHFKGGLKGWKEAGNPLEPKKG